MSLDSSARAIPWISSLAVAAAARVGLKAGATGFRLELAMGLRSTDNSSGERCCMACSITPFPARILAACIILSRPTISSSTIPSFHECQFRDSSCIITTSPTEGCGVCSPPLLLCCSLKLCMYSFDHLDHITSLHRRRFLALFLRSVS